MKWCTLLLLCLLVGQCSRPSSPIAEDDEASVYYWRTTFRLDSTERGFLETHRVNRMYLRLFDVSLNEEGEAIPVATLRFRDTVPEGVDVVPVVFIENNTLSQPDSLALRIAARVTALCGQQHLIWNELQTDCDWTSRTEEAYFQFLRALRRALPDKRLSTTIRLHQLRSAAPPADEGVLMCYNTGDFRDPRVRNAVLDTADIRPFLRALKTYKLPLRAAYPVFGWTLLFDRDQFRAILRDFDLQDTVHLRRMEENRWRVVRAFSIPSPHRNAFGMLLRSGYEVRRQQPTFNELRAAQRLLESAQEGLSRGVVLYSLHSNELKYYNSHELEELYRH